MKIITIKKIAIMSRYFLLGVFLQCVFYTFIMAGNTNAQLQPMSEIKININTQGRLDQVFRQIEKISEFRFSYNKSRIDLNQMVNVKSKNSSMSDVLLQISKQANLKFKRINESIHVTKLLNEENRIEEHFGMKQTMNITGTVLSGDDDSPLPGVNVVQKGTTNGTITDVEGKYSLSVPEGAVVVFSSVGYATQEITIENQSVVDVTMTPDLQQLEEIVIVGYGQQNKKSVVGSIVQASNEVLQRTGGVANLGQALTGQLPGVTTIQNTGEPGADDPTILIRGQSTWNNAQPLILVDGIERRMNDIDMSEVENVSVLKDASATAVFGVKGAEGVILITTKRGRKGKPQLEVGYNVALKSITKLPEKLNSFDGLSYRNRAIEHELSINEQGWGFYTPLEILDRYRNQQPGDEYIFPDVDWTDAITRDFGQMHRANVNITGGTDFVQYFGSLSYLHDGDILNSGGAKNRPYESRYAYDRFNFRTNLDLNVTQSTVFSVNLAGYYGIKTDNFGSDSYIWDAMYSLAPNAYPVTHEAGDLLYDYTIWGYNPQMPQPNNPMHRLNNTGVQQTNRSQILTDFRLNQGLDFITKGLGFTGTVSYDNRFNTSDGIYERQLGRALFKHIDPNIINAQPEDDLSQFISYDPALTAGEFPFDFVVPPATFQSETSNDGSNYRRLFYQLQMNYDNSFGKHNVGAMGLFLREEFARGSQFPRYREDWVSRITYNFDEKYLFEANGAYNGSERFGDDFKFGFFPSVAVGWLVSNEDFVNFSWLNHFKLRYSIGEVGNDAFNAPRWSYQTQWVFDDQPANFGENWIPSTYDQYVEGVIGNPFLQWETAVKQNLGIEMAFLSNMFRVNVDIFRDDRENIFMTASRRNVPVWFGAQPVAANLGQTQTTGYEVEFQFNKMTGSGFNYWANVNFTHAKDKVLYMEDPEMAPAYQKNAGFQIAQTQTLVNNGFMNNWDDLYASVGGQAGNREKLPGDLRLVDFNGDGVIDQNDDVPFAFPSRPQNTYNFTLGADYKGLAIMAQFYGVYNVTYRMGLEPFRDDLLSTVFDFTRNHWSPENTNADYIHPRLYTNSSASSLFHLDASYLRLKTAEISYRFEGEKLSLIGASGLRLFINGNNLLFWSDLPDDRESPGRSYPMFRRINFGVNVNF